MRSYCSKLLRHAPARDGLGACGWMRILTCSCCWRASSICCRCFSICEAASFFCSSWAARSCSLRLMSWVIMVESCRSFSARLSGVPATKTNTEHNPSNRVHWPTQTFGTYGACGSRSSPKWLSLTLNTLTAVRRIRLTSNVTSARCLSPNKSVYQVFLETEQQTKQAPDPF